jgi:hypothetical protein
MIMNPFFELDFKQDAQDAVDEALSEESSNSDCSSCGSSRSSRSSMQSEDRPVLERKQKFWSTKQMNKDCLR